MSGRSNRRTVFAAVVTTLVLATAVIAGLTSPTTGGTPVIFVERISSAISGTASRADVWWLYAFVLGAVAAFNPCGFALLPAYLGLYLRDDVTRTHLSARLSHSVAVALVVGASFTALFGVVGAIFEVGSAPIVRSLPWIGLGVGVLLIVTGGFALSGRHVTWGVPQRLAARIGKGATAPGLRGYGAFGVAYGAASLGCTLPLFLALMGTAAATSRLYGATIIAFVLYGAGMAVALGVLTVVAGVANFGILRHLRGSVRIVTTLSAGLLLLSGAYVVYYWLTAGRLLLT